MMIKIVNVKLIMIIRVRSIEERAIYPRDLNR